MRVDYVFDDGMNLLSSPALRQIGSALPADASLFVFRSCRFSASEALGMGGFVDRIGESFGEELARLWSEEMRMVRELTKHAAGLTRQQPEQRTRRCPNEKVRGTIEA
jgi:hypothetical protein